MVRSKRKARLLGVGLDGKDGKFRVTRGDNFHLIGGSADTHGLMQEKCIKFNEKLNAQGKQLDDLDQKEFLDLAQECKMNVVPSPPQNS